MLAGNAPHIPGCRDLSLIGERVARSLFSAVSDRVGGPVTVTVFPPLGDRRRREDFDVAAATAQRLGAHPSVITIHDWGHADDGRPWVVTDPQPAEAVDTLLVLDGPLTVERALQVGVLLAGAVETAHRAGILDGDLSPGRLVFGANGEPLLAETGLAEFAVFPGLGALNNPVRYHAPPEVLERTELSPATDVFSLATTVYALLAGRAPQQKPAEVTDSNASLLLRILQMPVPPIERPDLPAGLEDVLRSAMSPSPDHRPQRALEVAWMLQDVQRRAGMAVTEPVVLELDAPGAPALPGAALPGPGPVPAPAVPQDSPAPGSMLGADSVAGALPGAGFVPQVPPAEALPGAGFVPQVPPAEALPSAGFVPQVPPAEALPGEEVPPPTIFPFAEGVGAAAEDPWPAPPAGDGSPGTLWPSSWPGGDPAGDTPAWTVERPGGDKAGPLGDLGRGGGSSDPPATPAGDGSPGFGPVERPPELDQLPSWYTDPLPNAGGQPTPDRSNGHGSEPPVGRAGWRAAAQGDRGGAGAPPPAYPADPSAPRGERLPGAGDELRSLFGEVVGDPADPARPPNGAAPHRAAPPELRPGHLPPIDPAGDPLGPPRERPPTGRSRLDAPLGPAPFLPPSPAPERESPPLPRPSLAGRALEAGPAVPGRLPRRREVAARGSSGSSGRDDEAAAPAPSPLGRPDRSERPAPRQVAPSAERAQRRAATAGPPALPLLVLIGVVIVLIIGAAWMVVTGDDSEPPAADRRDEPAAEQPGAAGPAPATPTGVQVTVVAEGLSVTWQGAAEASYVVTIFSPDQPPQALPPAPGTSVTVPGVGAAPGGRCATVAVAPAASGAPGTPSPPACTPGATIEGMRRS
ncbi:MAG TPA: hypothetical protein VFZ77_07780 [Acidimicrobiales bacterium]